MRKYYYYYLKDPDTEEIRYLGITLSPKNRYYAHLYNTKSGLERNKWKANWIKSLLSQNKKPHMDIFRVFITNTSEEAYNLEQDLLEEHFKNGYNLVNVLKVPYVGSNPGSQRKIVYQYDGTTGDFIQEFPSVSDAARELNSSPTSLFRAIQEPGKRRSCGYYWSYEKFEKLTITKVSTGRPLIAQDVTNLVLSIYKENKTLSLRRIERICKNSGVLVSIGTIRKIFLENKE
jgi:hypothetical protein